MQKRYLGQTNIEITPLLVGTWQAGKKMWASIEDGRTAHHPRILQQVEVSEYVQYVSEYNQLVRLIDQPSWNRKMNWLKFLKTCYFILKYFGVWFTGPYTHNLTPFLLEHYSS